MLHTKDKPEGIFPLSPQYRQRVEQANRLYCFVQEVVEKCASKLIPFVEIPCVRCNCTGGRVGGSCCNVRVHFYVCEAPSVCLGIKRPKNTVLAFNRTAFLEIGAICPAFMNISREDV